MNATFPATKDAVAAARHFVLDHSEASGVGREHLALIASELAANAVLHAATQFEVRVGRLGDVVRVEVLDGCSRLPERRDSDRIAPSGRGLRIVERVAAHWGAECTDDGKVVWAEVVAPAARAGVAPPGLRHAADGSGEV